MKNYYKTDNFKCHTNSMDTIKLKALLRKLLTTFFLLLIAFVTSLKAWEVRAIKAPHEGLEVMKKYTIIRAVDDDGYVVAGSTISNYFIGNMVINIIKFNDNGTVDWSYFYNETGFSSEASHIDYSADSTGYIVSGFTNATQKHTGVVPILIEINNMGGIIRHKTLEIPGIFLKVKPTPKGDYIAVGFQGDTSILDHKFALCIKFDNTLAPLWTYKYTGYFGTAPIGTRFYEAIQSIYIAFDGLDERYILGGNATSPFSLPGLTSVLYSPTINLHEIDEVGNVLESKTYLFFKPTVIIEPYDIFVQDILVVEDPSSAFYNDIYLLGQEIPVNTYRIGNYFSTIIRFKRNPISVDSDVLHLEGNICKSYHLCRSNNFKMYKDTLHIFGTMETEGTAGKNIQIPFIAQIEASLPFNSQTPLNQCDPRPYPCIMFADGTSNGDDHYDGYRLLFSDYLGTSPVMQGYPDIQLFGQSLGYADFNQDGNLRYGIVSNKKYSLLDPLWSLFIVSNLDDNYCDAINGHLYNESSATDFTDTFQLNTYELSPVADSLQLLKISVDYSTTICDNYNTNIGFVWPEPTPPGFFTESLIQSEINSNYIHFYPNPFFDYIKLNGVNISDRIKIFNNKGVKVFDCNYNNLPLDLKVLETGVYWIHITRANELIFNSKLMKLFN